MEAFAFTEKVETLTLQYYPIFLLMVVGLAVFNIFRTKYFGSVSITYPNNKKVNIPSYSVKPGDVVQVRDKSRKMDIVLDSMKRIKGDLDLPWLELDKAKMTGNVIAIPEREDMQVLLNEQLVVELYSK